MKHCPRFAFALAIGSAALLLASHRALAQAAARTVDPATTQRVNPALTQTVEVIGVTAVPGLGIAKDQIPAPVQTARGDDIERSHADDLGAYLARRLASVHLNDIQGNGLQADVNFRGFAASPLLGSAQGLSVYLDGVRLNQPFGDVVSWDLIPRSAIAAVTLMPGSNPLFGLNTLGGALVVQTKDGLKYPGTSLQVSTGLQHRAALSFETGGSRPLGLHWFVTGQHHQDKGWRVGSPSDVNQGFAKLGQRWADTSITLTAALADNRLQGNGLQEQRALAQDWHSVYTQPDITHNRAMLLSLAATQGLGAGLSASGQVFYRRVSASTLNGDINPGSLNQPLYQPRSDPDAQEQAALAAAGYSGFPLAGESAANTPFPRWRCLASALLRAQPAALCNGVLNRSQTDQSQAGLTGQLHWQGRWAGLAHQAVAGAALEWSRVHFTQGSELGYLNADRSVTGVGAFGDGRSGTDADGLPYDNRVDLSARNRTASLYASDTVALDARTHLTLAARYNRSSVKNRDAITPGGGTGSLDGDHTFARLNPALGLTFAAHAGLTAYAGLNQGSRSPSAVELGCADPAQPCKLPNAMAGDPPLQPVITRTLEAGLRGAAGAGRWNIGLFRADNHNDILFVADNAAGYGYFKNFGQTRRQGLEAGVSTRLAGAALGANLTLLQATFQSDELLNGAGNSSNDSALAGLPGIDGNIAVRAGQKLPLVPSRLLKLFADVPLGGGWTVAADVSAVGPSLARGNENNGHQSDGTFYLGPGRSAGYALLNLGLEGRPLPGWTVFVQINNLLDRRYTTAAQLGATGLDAQGRFIAQPLAPNSLGDRPLVHATFYAPGAPRSLGLGLRRSFGD